MKFPSFTLTAPAAGTQAYRLEIPEARAQNRLWASRRRQQFS
jgi:hypothetical protein